jgi:hypothetical protein
VGGGGGEGREGGKEGGREGGRIVKERIQRKFLEILTFTIFPWALKIPTDFPSHLLTQKYAKFQGEVRN